MPSAREPSRETDSPMARRAPASVGSPGSYADRAARVTVKPPSPYVSAVRYPCSPSSPRSVRSTREATPRPSSIPMPTARVRLVPGYRLTYYRQSSVSLTLPLSSSTAFRMEARVSSMFSLSRSGSSVLSLTLVYNA